MAFGSLGEIGDDLSEVRNGQRGLDGTLTPTPTRLGGAAFAKRAAPFFVS